MTEEQKGKVSETYYNMASYFAKLMRVRKKDLNARASSMGSTTIPQYKREDILDYLKSPQQNAERLTEASIYLYVTSLYYQRIINYFSNMPTFDYVIVPSRLKDYDVSEQGKKKYAIAYHKALDKVENINIKQTFSNILKVVLREGAFYGIELETKESYMIYQFPYSKCRIASSEDGCPLFSINLDYFDNNALLLESIGGVLETAYRTYKSGKGDQWYELPSESSICILADETLDYIIPPLAGCFPDLYLVDNLKDLVETKEVQELYKLINLEYPMDSEGNLLMDEDLARGFFGDIAEQLPDQIGAVLNPFKSTPISFERNTIDRDVTARAERDLFSLVGIPSLLFNNDKATSSALSNSINNDYTYVKPIIKSMERWLNKKLKLLSGSIKFKATLLDVTIYNRKEFADSLRKDMMYGLPIKAVLAAVNSTMSMSDIYGASYLENEVLGFSDKLVVPKSANTIAADSENNNEGRPESEEPLTESGEKTKDGELNDG